MKSIPVTQICANYNIPQSFIDDLYRYDLIELIEIESVRHISNSEIAQLERLMRMHYDLEINFEGLDVINNLLQQIDDLQNELTILRNRIDFYE